MNNRSTMQKVIRKAAALTGLKGITNKKFVEFIYELVLQRKPDEHGMKIWLNAMRGGMEPMELFKTLVESEEFAITSAKNKNFNLNYPRRKMESAVTEPGVERKDQLDALNFIDLKDDWVKFEEIIVRQHAEGNKEINDVLKSIYLNEDRAESFNRFLNSREFHYIKHLLSVLGVKPLERICEVGGGAGYLSWALHQTGYQYMTLFEPNPSKISGVAHLKSLPEAANIHIYSDLHEWHSNKAQYDVILTKACLHHFGNISQVAASIRQKMPIGGRWIALREQFSDTPQELAVLLRDHDYCQKHNLYEWGYTAAMYVEALELVGLRLTAIVPSFYANDCIGTNLENPDTEESLKFTAEIDGLLQHSPDVTVERFWEEHYARYKSNKVPLQYTRPQVMVFEKILV